MPLNAMRGGEGRSSAGSYPEGAPPPLITDKAEYGTAGQEAPSGAGLRKPSVSRTIASQSEGTNPGAGEGPALGVLPHAGGVRLLAIEGIPVGVSAARSSNAI
ncbi:hypothetical protein TRAPUB_622 [Trametes pubescens]|uniref:Uncharacterized protein n=1 Tax=Trametes pubescens TaxID=154538 RepID=A0A1M2VLF6_TRAPU|nr:hypothetical protein TRAPUB_622 [Trametes pubescens]